MPSEGDWFPVDIYELLDCAPHMFSTAGTIPFLLKTFTAFISEHMLRALHLEDDSTAHQVLASVQTLTAAGL